MTRSTLTVSKLIWQPSRASSRPGHFQRSECCTARKAENAQKSRGGVCALSRSCSRSSSLAGSSSGGGVLARSSLRLSAAGLGLRLRSGLRRRSGLLLRLLRSSRSLSLSSLSRSRSRSLPRSRSLRRRGLRERSRSRRGGGERRSKRQTEDGGFFAHYKNGRVLALMRYDSHTNKDGDIPGCLIWTLRNSGHACGE